MKEKIERIIKENISEYNFCVKKLSEILNISTSYLRETSHLLFNKSPKKLIESIKIQKAEELISSGKPITTVCKHTGFLYTKTFRRVFKRHIGMTPALYKKNHSK